MPRDRLLSMIEVADLLQPRRLTGKPDHYRAQYVRRMIRRVERRDGRPLLTKRGKDCYIALSSVEHLAHWDPSTLGAMRADIRELDRRLKALRRQVNSQGAQIRDLKRFRKATVNYLTEVGESV